MILKVSKGVQSLVLLCHIIRHSVTDLSGIALADWEGEVGGRRSKIQPWISHHQAHTMILCPWGPTTSNGGGEIFV